MDVQISSDFLESALESVNCKVESHSTKDQKENFINFSYDNDKSISTHILVTGVLSILGYIPTLILPNQNRISVNTIKYS